MLRSNPVRILIGLAAGLVAGVLAGGTSHAASLLAITSPIGRLWLDALTMTVVPLVFSLLVTGLIGAGESRRESNVAGRALGWFAILLVGACLLSAAGTTFLLHLWPVPEAAHMLQAPAGEMPPASSAGDWLAGIIPPNPIKAAADTAMVPLVVFALLFGFAASQIQPDLRGALQLFFRATVETMLVIVRWVLLTAPLGVFALAFGVGARSAGGAAAALGQYIVVVATTCLLVTLVAYVVVLVLGRMSPMRFARAALPVQIVAASTQSSLASLPAMIEAAPSMEVERGPAGIILPLAVSVFRAASAAANMAVAVYLAHLHGIPLGLGTLLVGSLVGAVVSLAAVGLPAQVSFFATIAPVCLALGVPIGLLPLLLAVESIPDLFRTVGNVTSDLVVLRLAGRVRQKMPR